MSHQNLLDEDQEVLGGRFIVEHVNIDKEEKLNQQCDLSHQDCGKG